MVSCQFRVALASARGYIVVLSSLFGIGIALAAPGNLDPGFGKNGLWSLTGSSASAAYAVVQQSDGKLVLAGKSEVDFSLDFIVARLAADGTPDAAFGVDGIATVDFGGTGDVAFAVIQQSDGKLVLAGTAWTAGVWDDASSDMALARFNTDGSLDTTFGNAGLVTLDLDVFDYASDVIQQANGKLVVAGATNSTNERVGTSKATFARFNANGSLDTSFGSGGSVSVDFGSELESRADSLAQQADGMLVAVGTVRVSSLDSSDMGLMRLTADGVLDPLFDGDGMIAVDFDGNRDEAFAVAIQPDGAIVAAGASWGSEPITAALLRVNGDGSLDSTFGDGGKSVINLGGRFSVLRSILVRADNSLAATGIRNNSADFHDDMIVARFLSNGTLDLAYAVDGVATADFNIGNNLFDSQGFALIQQADGKLVAVGPTQVGTLSAARFVDDGTILPGIISFIDPNQRVAEATATVVYTVRRTGGSDGSVSVHYATAAGLALPDSDFEDASGNLSWDNGDSGDRFITIDLIDDAEVEGDEHFLLTLSEPTGGAVIGTRATATVSIADNDTAAPPTITVAATDANAAEQGLGTGTFTITRTGSTAANLTVFHSIGGTANPATSVDYNGQSGGSTLIPAGASTATVTITPVDDATVEDPETVTLTITTNADYVVADAPQNTASITIADNDAAPTPPPSSGGGGGGGRVAFVSLLLLGVARLLRTDGSACPGGTVMPHAWTCGIFGAWTRNRPAPH